LESGLLIVNPGSVGLPAYDDERFLVRWRFELSVEKSKLKPDS
jgi:hypothetical protein